MRVTTVLVTLNQKWLKCPSAAEWKTKYSWSLNNPSLNYAGPLRCGFFFRKYTNIVTLFTVGWSHRTTKVCKTYCKVICADFWLCRGWAPPAHTLLEGQLYQTEIISKQRQPTLWMNRTNTVCEISQIQLNMIVSNYVKYKNRKI